MSKGSHGKGGRKNNDWQISFTLSVRMLIQTCSSLLSGKGTFLVSSVILSYLFLTKKSEQKYFLCLFLRFSCFGMACAQKFIEESVVDDLDSSFSEL